MGEAGAMIRLSLLELCFYLSGACGGMEDMPLLEVEDGRYLRDAHSVHPLPETWVDPEDLRL